MCYVFEGGGYWRPFRIGGQCEADMDAEFKNAIGEIAPFARGGPTNDGKSWMLKAELDAVTKFEDVVALATNSVFQLKASLIKSSIRRLETHMDDARKANALFGKIVADTRVVEVTLKDCYITKLNATTIKILSKNSDIDTKTAGIKTEISAICDKYSDYIGFPPEYQEHMPKGLRDEVMSVLAMRRKK